MSNLFNKIFYKKEFGAVTEKGNRNFWILFLVFLGAIGAIEFSRSGQHYLNHVMDDPFVNWVEVSEQGNFDAFSSYMQSQQEQFNIYAIENNYYLISYVYSTERHKIRALGRTISPQSKLLTSLLDPCTNGAVTEYDFDDIPEQDYGWIVTKEFLKRLGYDGSNQYPLFIKYAAHDEDLKYKGWNVPIISQDSNFVSLSIPLIAVVDKLPNMLDFMALQQFCYQLEDHEISPFLPSLHPEYFMRTQFVSDYNNLEDTIVKIVENLGFGISEIKKDNYYECLRSATSYKIRYVEDSITTINKINELLEDKLQEKAYHVFEYQFNTRPDVNKIKTNYISFMFNDLSSVPAFAEEAQNKGIRIDMTQIKAKENITTFNTLITLLCISILVISIIFLAIFIWFLIDSHFRSISKNLGTIMAFGLSNRTIIKLYVAIFLSLILGALISALAILGLTEIVCRVFDFSRDTGYYYFVINDPMVITTILCIPILSLIVVVFTMYIKLKATPGDLILERD